MNGLTNLPRDVTNPIFLKLTNSVAALNVFQRVSRGLKTIVDDPEFLRLLLIKLKGRKFSDPVYTSAPKKYLYLDRDLTLAIGKKIKITSIVLQDLNLRVFTLRMNNANVYHYQFSEKIKDALKTVDVRDRKRWRKCIGNIADCLAKVKIIGESTIELPYLEKIKCGFDNPNKEMKKYKIKEVFYGSAVHLIVHHKSCMTEPVLLDMVNANLNEEERGVVATSQLLSHFLLQVALVPRDGRFKLVSKGMPKENVLAKLNALTREQKAAIEQTLPDDINKYLLGTFFPRFGQRILMI